MNQNQALKILKSGANVFLTGSAGTGKTFLLNKFINYLKKEKIKVGITASTGIASTHIGGTTIHSWAGIGITKDINDPKIKRFLKGRTPKWKEIRDTKVLIIDEISMLDSERLVLIDRVCKEIKDPFLPFGGIQLVVCGDFFQLPPINDNTEEKPELAYTSPAWKRARFKVCYLEKQYRQDDKKFINILNDIRNNKATTKTLEEINTRLNKNIYGFDKVTKLYSHNRNVDKINSLELSKIKEPEKQYVMTYKGGEKLIEILKKGCLAPETLKLKKGAIVIFVKNNYKEGYVNGTLGTVVGFEEEFPIIETIKGKRVIAMKTQWNFEKNDEVLATIWQIPLRLAWAITIHKSQGMSLDAAEIDLSRSFDYGMGYVALSRVRRLSNIKLIGINENALKVNQEITEKDKEFMELSKENEEI
ncbi:MAG: PIF1 family ATP-dependent DNA helicase [Candidatus Paceibacterota bacterium]|jgi:ATP-dependent exoDNAse (exonuclease V) alpha subunit